MHKVRQSSLIISTIKPFFWHIVCRITSFVSPRQQYWADGLNVFRRRMCPPDFLSTKIGLPVLLVTLYYIWSRSGGGTTPNFCAIFGIRQRKRSIYQTCGDVNSTLLSVSVNPIKKVERTEKSYINPKYALIWDC